MSDSITRRALRSAAAIDTALACLVAIVAYRVAYSSLASSPTAPWLEDLLVPCTGRPGWVPDPAVLKALPQWHDFINRRIEFFPCDAIAGMPLLEVGVAWEQVRYFHLALGAWFRWLGPTLEGFVTFQAGLFAVASAFAYLVFRLGLWRPVALVCTAGLVWSKWQLAAVSLPIEYAKTPWLFASLWLCGVIIRRDAKGKPLWIPALLAGLVAGVGIGFKTDVLAAVPLALATTLIFVRGTPAGPSRRLVATVAVMAGVAIGGGAILYRSFFGSAGSVLAVQFLGGQDSLTEGLYATSALYDYGLRFDDSHITALINAYGRRVLGMTDAAYFYSREMQAMSTRLLLDLWTTFPGDFILRVNAATLRVLQLGGFGLPVALLGLVALLTKDVRAGWFAVFVTVYLSAYVSLVFQRRHFFHLEIISWWLAGFLVQAAMFCAWAAIRRPEMVPSWRGLARQAAIATALVGAVGAAGVTMLAAARIYQAGRVARLVDQYAQAALDERGTVRGEEGGDGVLVRVDGVSVREGEPGWPTDRMIGDYLVVRFTCRDAGDIVAVAKYRSPGQDWDSPYRIPCSQPQTTSTLMVPIYQYGDRHRFDGLWLAPQDADTIEFVGTMRPDATARPWLPMQLPADWRSRPLYKELKATIETP